MNAIGAAIAAALWKLLQPYIAAQWQEMQPKILAFIQEQFTEWMPKIIKATVVAVAQSAGHLTVDTVDKVTNVIPGDLDDQVLDGMVTGVLDQLRRFGL
jgi:hypothetical protein